MKIKKFCATATLLAAACAMQAGAMAADTPTAAATAGTATQSTVGTAVTATNQTASTDAATGELLPSDVQTSSDGLQLKKIYDVGKTTSPDKIPQADFERGGFKYTFEDLLKIELPEMERKVHSETVTVSSSSSNTNDVLSLLPKSKSVSTTDGYSGTAYLDISSISTKVAGTESVSNDLSATREYPGMTEMDMESIPKSITENGHTLRFADVEWKEANAEADNFGTVQTTYTAVVSYTGTATSSRTTGYAVTATYAGEVSRRNNEGVRYIAVYSGTPIEEIPAIPEEEQGHEEDPPDLTGLIDPEQQDNQNDERKAPLISWVLCAVFGILMLLFAFRPPMCRRMMRQMQMGAQAVREKINNETERIKRSASASRFSGRLKKSKPRSETAGNARAVSTVSPHSQLRQKNSSSATPMKSLLKAPMQWTKPRITPVWKMWNRSSLSRTLLSSAMALTMMVSTPAFASNLTYNFSGASAGNFGKSTSIDPVTTIGADSVNRDISKNSAFIPPEFGSPQADILGTGELLTPDISGVEPMFPHSTQANFGQTVTSNGAMSGGGEIIMPPDAENTTVSSAPIYEISTGTAAVSETDSLGGYTGGGADAAYGSGYTSTSGMKYSDGSIGKLSIPSIGVNKKVYDGETIANMRLGAAHFEGTSGWDGNVAMCGHNRGSYGYFGNIHTLKNGDTISYTTIFGTRTYKVYSVRKIAKTDTSVLDPSDANIITLITCVRDVPSQRWCVQAMAI